MNEENYINRKRELTTLFRMGTRSDAVNKLSDLRNEYPELKNEIVLISILTPSYNSSKYIEETIQSVINQTYLFVEHIIQDGNSTDGTKNILKKYSQYTDWVSEPDSGEPDGLNKAVKRARGDIFLVLNADDVLLPDSCSRAVQQFHENPEVAVIYGNQHMIDSKGEILYDRIPSPYDFIKELCVENVIPAQTAFIQRKFFEKAGLYIDASLPVIPDYELWIRIGLKFPMLYIPAFICKYRVHDYQQTTQISKIEETRILIMDRVFNNPEFSDLHKYRERAYAGNLHWAAVEYYKSGNKKTALSKLLKSYELNPDSGKVYPLISIITVTDNSGKNLGKCIQSVLNQSYLYVEHIVIDNNSTDGTLEILQQYDSQVDWVSRNIINTADAINQGIKKCHGDIIHILNPDDEMSDNTCWWGTYHFRRFPDNIVVFGDYYLIDADSSFTGKKIRNKPFRYKKMFCLEDEIPLNPCFINKKYFENIGHNFDTAYPACYFYEFLVRAGKQYNISYHKGLVSCHRIIRSEKDGRKKILRTYEEKNQIIIKNYKSNKNPYLIKKRAIAGLNYWLSKELLAYKMWRQGFKQLFLSIINPYTFAHIIESFFMVFIKMFLFIRHLNYLLILKPSFKYRRKIGLTSEQINSVVFKKSYNRFSKRLHYNK
jgi:glycosyltransferase involved in cell wall biosynthesis